MQYKTVMTKTYDAEDAVKGGHNKELTRQRGLTFHKDTSYRIAKICKSSAGLFKMLSENLNHCTLRLSFDYSAANH